MSKMSKRKINTLNIVISVLVAFASWVYVAVNVSPTVTKTFRNVPVTFEGEYELGQRGLGIESANIDTINVTVTLPRTELGKISAEDIDAVANVSDANKGENLLSIDVQVPSRMTIKTQSSSSIKVEVAASNNVDVDVAVGYALLETADSTTEPMATELSAEKVSVVGASDQVDKVAYVLIPINEGSISEKTESSFTVNPIAVDKNGNEVPYIVIMPSSISATVIKASVKTVDLKVTVSDTNASEDKSYDVPSTIVIKGNKSTIDAITEISAEAVDISDIKEDSTIALKFNLPEGVQIATSSKGAAVKVKIKK